MPEGAREGPVEAGVRLALAQGPVGGDGVAVRPDADERVGQDALENVLVPVEADHAHAVRLVDEQVAHEVVGGLPGLGRGFEDAHPLESPVLVRAHFGDEDPVPRAVALLLLGEVGPEPGVEAPGP